MNDLILSTWIRSQAFLARFARDDKGAALAEYAVIFLVVATAGAVALVTLGTNIAEALTAVGAMITRVITTPMGAAGAGAG